MMERGSAAAAVHRWRQVVRLPEQESLLRQEETAPVREEQPNPQEIEIQPKQEDLPRLQEIIPVREGLCLPEDIIQVQEDLLLLKRSVPAAEGLSLRSS